LLVLFHSAASTAIATSFSLIDLVENDVEFESLDGGLDFEGFSASLDGAPGSDLSLFSVVPVLHGFRVELGSGQSLPGGAELLLSYQVEGEEHDAQTAPLMSMALGLSGTSILSADMIAVGDGDAYPGSDPILGELTVSIEAGGVSSAAVDFTTPRDEIQVQLRLVFTGDSSHSPEEGGSIEMGFSSEPVPEPSTGLLVILGLGGLSIFKRTQRVRS